MKNRKSNFPDMIRLLSFIYFGIIGGGILTLAFFQLKELSPGARLQMFSVLLIITLIYLLLVVYEFMIKRNNPREDDEGENDDDEGDDLPGDIFTPDPYGKFFVKPPKELT